MIQLLLTQVSKARSHNLGISQLILMLAIYDEDMNMSQIAKQIRLSSAAVTGLVDRLEKQGLVQRNTTIDRRKLIITMTDLGKQTIDDILSKPETQQPQ